MLSSVNRMRVGTEFATCVRRGRRAARRTIVLHLVTGDGDQPPRVGFVVSKAVGAAVTRNRVKRRLRHLLRARVSGLPAGSLLVVRACTAAATASHRDLGVDLDAALHRLSADSRAPR